MYKGLVVRFADVLSFFFNIYDENEIIWSHFHRIIKKRGGGGGGGQPRQANRHWNSCLPLYSNMCCEISVFRKEFWDCILAMTNFSDANIYCISLSREQHDASFGVSVFEQTCKFVSAKGKIKLFYKLRSNCFNK